MNASDKNPKMTLIGKVGASIVACATALIIVRFATWVEGRLARVVTGLACAVIATVTPLVQHPRKSPLPRRWKQWYRDRVPHVSRPLSKIAFLLLFASLGSTISQLSSSTTTTTTIAMSSAATQARVAWLQSGPACIIVSLLSLLVHCVFILTTSWLWVVWPPKWSLFRNGQQAAGTVKANNHQKTNGNVIYLEDVLVASNAAIGGPATAAAFCGRIPQGTIRISSFLKGLAYAATVWGIVGYAIGTTVGVFSY
ncbi:hypothetical protein ACA910_021959 [Epithemia clementina (nom. ined.)]